MTKAPSIKEALEFYADPRRYKGPNQRPIMDDRFAKRDASYIMDVTRDGGSIARAALATLQPDGERREAIARIIDPDTYHAYDIHKKAGTVAENGKPWCDVVCGKDIADALAKADLILASGLVQDEAGWRDISTAPKDKTIMLCVDGFEPCSGRWWPLDSCWVSFDWEGHFDTDQEMSSYVAGTSYDPTHWKPLPAPPIRSARDGGAET